MTVFMDNDERLEILHTYSSLNDRVLRVRKQKRNKKNQKCLYCESIIKAGKGSYYITGMNAGRFYNYHVCYSCYEDK